MTVSGQNHLHRGIDRRGVSTLGNFIAELAIAEGVQSFHVVLFAAGGKINYCGLQELDQRKEDQGFCVSGLSVDVSRALNVRAREIQSQGNAFERRPEGPLLLAARAR